MGKFEIYRDKAGEHRFRLKAGNGQIILASEGYSSKDGCENGIESVRENSQNEERYDVSDTKNGGCKFNLKAGNGQVIGSSEVYNSEAACANGIESVMKNAPDAEVVECD